jgi:hypothetical protein
MELNEVRKHNIVFLEIRKYIYFKKKLSKILWRDSTYPPYILNF